MNIRSVVCRGALFDYADQGQGDAVLFLHGGLGDWRTWKPHLQLLEQTHRAIAYTQRYFGINEWPKDGPAFGIDAHVDDLIGFIETLEIAPLHLVAWSYSGHAALQAALIRPDLFQGILIYEPGFPTFLEGEEEIAAFQQEANAMFGPIFEAMQAGDADEAARRLIDESGGPGYFSTQPPERQRIYLDNAHTMPLLLISQTPPPAITATQLAQIKTPTSIICGQQTRPAFRIVAQAAARFINNGRHKVIANAGHLWPEEDPAGFISLVKQWLSETAAS